MIEMDMVFKPLTGQFKFCRIAPVPVGSSLLWRREGKLTPAI
jgi:hypothetical protein